MGAIQEQITPILQGVTKEFSPISEPQETVFSYETKIGIFKVAAVSNPDSPTLDVVRKTIETGYGMWGDPEIRADLRVYPGKHLHILVTLNDEVALTVGLENAGSLADDEPGTFGARVMVPAQCVDDMKRRLNVATEKAARSQAEEFARTNPISVISGLRPEWDMSFENTFEVGAFVAVNRKGEVGFDPVTSIPAFALALHAVPFVFPDIFTGEKVNLISVMKPNTSIIMRRAGLKFEEFDFLPNIVGRHSWNVPGFEGMNYPYFHKYRDYWLNGMGPYMGNRTPGDRFRGMNFYRRVIREGGAYQTDVNGQPHLVTTKGLPKVYAGPYSLVYNSGIAAMLKILDKA